MLIAYDSKMDIFEGEKTRSAVCTSELNNGQKKIRRGTHCLVNIMEVSLLLALPVVRRSRFVFVLF